MTGLHDKRPIKEPRRSKRLARSRPEAAAPPPARRTRPAEVTVHPRKREASVAAARTERPPSSPYGERDPEAPPTRRTRRAEALFPPCKRAEASVPAARATPSPSPGWDSGVWTRRRVLRNREVLYTTPQHCEPAKPTPRHNEKGKERKQDLWSWQTPRCAFLGLEYYNIMNQGDEHEMVKPVISHLFTFDTIYWHANFLAKRKGATSCVDLVPKYFFAELKMEESGYSCVSCVKLNPGDLGGCRTCPQELMHPAGGEYLCAQPRPVKHAVGGLQISFSF